MVMKVEEPGLLTTVQDLGRYGYQDIGLPSSGAMDNYALRVANILVGNDENKACLEITFKGPTLLVQRDCYVAITGADLQPTLNGADLPMWETHGVQEGDKLSFGLSRRGMRAYLAVSGGIAVPKIMGSRSTYLRNQLGGIKGRALKAGDIIKIGSGGEKKGGRVPKEYIPDHTLEDIRVVIGPQDDLFTQEGIDTFLSSQYQVTSESDRMGIRLDGPVIEHANGADIISDAIPPGGVQVPGSGKPIILMRDRQTTGGYAKIATVISADIDRLAQAKPGDKISFKEIPIQKAHKLLRERESKISALRENLKKSSKPLKKKMRFQIEDEVYEVELEKLNEDQSLVWVDGKRYQITKGEERGEDNRLSSPRKPEKQEVIRAPLPGEVEKILVNKGSKVKVGHVLLILEALKMENDINSPVDGIVRKISVNEGDKISDGQELIILEEK